MMIRVLPLQLPRWEYPQNAVGKGFLFRIRSSALLSLSDVPRTMSKYPCDLIFFADSYNR